MCCEGIDVCIDMLAARDRRVKKELRSLDACRRYATSALDRRGSRAGGADPFFYHSRGWHGDVVGILGVVAPIGFKRLGENSMYVFSVGGQCWSDACVLVYPESEYRHSHPDLFLKSLFGDALLRVLQRCKSPPGLCYLEQEAGMPGAPRRRRYGPHAPVGGSQMLSSCQSPRW